MLVLAVACVTLARLYAYERRRADEASAMSRSLLLKMMRSVPWALRLGTVVEAKKYEASDWVRCNVICTSWKGAMRVRPVGDERGGWWVPRSRVADRVREARQ